MYRLCKIYCETEGEWKFAIGDHGVGLTKCPDNDQHDVGIMCAVNSDKLTTNFDGYPLELSLSDKKKIRCAEINERSIELDKTFGFTYNHDSVDYVFSLELDEQINALGALAKKDLTGMLPIEYNTMDDSTKIELTTVSEVEDFTTAAALAKKVRRDVGTTLKDSIRAATNDTELDAVIDNRNA